MSFVISPQLQHLFDTQPGSWGCRDLASRFLYANQLCAHFTGFLHKEELIGLTDLDLRCPAVACAPLFRAQDREVLQSGERLRILDIHCCADKKWRSFLTTKTPLRDKEKNIVGTIFCCQELNSRELLELGILLNKITHSAKDSALLTSSTSYTIGHPAKGPRLSPRQEEILFLLLRGRSARQIALALGIAARTVEWHQQILKEKFGARSKSELVEKAIELGHLHNLPPGLSKRALSIILRDG
ncbi:MAG: helix-turn-helix transcriptional regulator [Paludibacterium sp.]|uniref:helix-turn-helix transcriptional regulator n=1 Tax=Paludibacterium sp. TaxID=1917523 RepID=UPI0025E07906|nr:helix-turn-helix transcriptional regulator [Paludibacterium sp.]MBV8047472.1 helix-turn-helix transcriptional regulator [Paludibacterium sp.]MBV8646730.1 helix-turn-helix transcriptional regulator [Paludibacterium sp.]